MRFGAMDGVLGRNDAEAFARARRLGLDGVEVNLRVAELRDAACARPAALRRLSEEQSLAIPSLCLGEHNSGGVATWWRGSDAEEEIRLAIDWAGRLGAETLLVPFFFFNEPKGAAHRKALAERLRPLVELAATRGVTIAYEGVLPARHLLEMAGLVGTGGFGVYFDVANAAWCDLDPAAEILALGALLRQCHAKEATAFTGDARLGEGRVDHAACAAALRSIGYDRWIVLETPGGADDDIARDIAFARRTYGP